MNYTITRSYSTNYDHDVDQAALCISNMIKTLERKGCSTNLLMTSGDFLGGPWVELEISSKEIDNWYPPERIMEQLISAGESEVKEVIRQVKPILAGRVKYLTIGCDPVIINDQFFPIYNAELVYLYDVEKDRIDVTGKHFPTSKQEKMLLRFQDVDSHFHTLGDTKVMILGCHDLNVFSGRSRKQLSDGTNRKTVSDQLIARASQFKPEIVLHHPHSTDTPRIWQAGWGGLKKILPCVKHYASGIYYPEDARGDLNDVLNSTQYGNVLSVEVK